MSKTEQTIQLSESKMTWEKIPVWNVIVMACDGEWVSW